MIIILFSYVEIAYEFKREFLHAGLYYSIFHSLTKNISNILAFLWISKLLHLWKSPLKHSIKYSWQEICCFLLFVQIRYVNKAVPWLVFQVQYVWLRNRAFDSLIEWTIILNSDYETIMVHDRLGTRIQLNFIRCCN